MSSITKEWKAGKPAEGWRGILAEEFKQPYMKALIRFLDQERARFAIHPDPPNIFRAFTLTDYDLVKVVILGQDPYPTPGHANGLAFSTNDGVALPKSLQNIYKEIESDLGIRVQSTGNLDRWATQGVFMLNTALTVRSRSPNSHRNKGWEKFTQRAIRALAEREKPLVFFLWGKNAQNNVADMDLSRHCVLKAPHPSPLSASSGFFGCRHFSRANAFLESNGLPPIDWS